jgi:CRISPR-associated protein Cmr4
MTGLENLFTAKNYLALALDPVHVGAGGYRLGRVDNTIIREPATDLPKLPGTSLAGVARTYTAMAIQAENATPLGDKRFPFRRPRLDTHGMPVIKKDKFVYDHDNYDSCAGKGGDRGEKHCGKENCPVCMAFGYSDGQKNLRFQGLALFSDARILLFPVTSMQGPVWITSPAALTQFFEDCPPAMRGTIACSDFIPEADGIATMRVDPDTSFNLGWLLFKNQKKIQPLSFSGDPLLLTHEMQERTVLVSDDLFPRLVNDNLEVRTSVAIDPATGAADEGALYTYEALPRSTVLWFPVRYQEPAHFRPGNKEVQLTRDQLIVEVEKGLSLMAVLGVGGKGSRGMGRLKCLNLG